MPADSLGNPVVAADGAGSFVVGWTASGATWLRRLALDGTLDTTTIPVALYGDYLALVWLQPNGASAFRVGYAKGSLTAASWISYRPYFALVATSGALLSPESLLAPGEANNAANEIVGFARADDHNTIVWTDYSSYLTGTQAYVASFDDSGTLLGSRAELLSSESILSSRYGLAIHGNDAYFGVTDYPYQGLLVARGLSSAFTPVALDGAADRPVLAFTDAGDLGVLGPGDPSGGPLYLSTVRDGTEVASRLVASKGLYPDTYGLAGGASSFAVVWATDTDGVEATITTP